jgi:hypothetical protein
VLAMTPEPRPAMGAMAAAHRAKHVSLPRAPLVVVPVIIVVSFAMMSHDLLLLLVLPSHFPRQL